VKKQDPVREYLAEIGARGGAVGGRASGPRKARSAEHYAAMVEARRIKRLALVADHATLSTDGKAPCPICGKRVRISGINKHRRITHKGSFRNE
jgi:hypothetical protein